MIKKEALKTPSASRCSVVFFSFSCCKKGPRDNLANHLVLFFPGEKPTRTYWFYSSLEKNHANRLVLFFPGEKPREQTGFILPQRKPRRTDWFYSTPEKTAANKLVLFYPEKTAANRLVSFYPAKTPAYSLVSFYPRENPGEQTGFIQSELHVSNCFFCLCLFLAPL